MKMLVSSVAIAILLFVAGCGEPLADFAAGLGTGLVVRMGEANKAMESLDNSIAAAKEKAAEIEILIEKDPSLLVNEIDPNLGNELQKFLINIKGIEAHAKEFTDEKGKVNWLAVALAVIGIFGGGTATNIYKNSKKP